MVAEVVTTITIPILSLLQMEVDPTEDYPLYVQTNILHLDWSNPPPQQFLIHGYNLAYIPTAL